MNEVFIRERRLKNATMYYNGSGLIKIVLDDNIELDVADIKEQRSVVADFTSGKSHVILAITGSNTSATKEAREYSSSTATLGRVAEAIVISSLAVRLMGNIYIHFHKPGVITKMFESEQKALEWLREQMAGSIASSNSIKS